MNQSQASKYEEKPAMFEVGNMGGSYIELPLPISSINEPSNYAYRAIHKSNSMDPKSAMRDIDSSVINHGHSYQNFEGQQ